MQGGWVVHLWKLYLITIIFCGNLSVNILPRAFLRAWARISPCHNENFMTNSVPYNVSSRARMFYTIAEPWRCDGRSQKWEFAPKRSESLHELFDNSAIVEVLRYVVFPHERLTGPDGTSKSSENKPLHDFWRI